MACAVLLATLGAAEGSERASVDAPAEVTREECFALFLDGDGDPQTPESVVGVAALRRIERNGRQAEWDVRFRDDDTRVLHVEHWNVDSPKLVWREWRPGSGRTVLAEMPSSSSALEIVEWGRTRRARRRTSAEEGGLLPLYFLELARRGEIASGSFPRFDPLSCTVERVHVATSFAGAAGGLVERRIELTYTDGVDAGGCVFRGDELIEFRWQGGGLVARRIGREEFEARSSARIDFAASTLESR